jgi:hypothetical protein
MPSVKDLVLTVSRDSQKRVGVEIAYSLAFTDDERAANVEVIELVFLFERRGLTDRFFLQHFASSGTAGIDHTVGGSFDAEDALIALLHEGGQRVDAIGATSSAPVPRSVKRLLTTDELAKLTQVGRENPYAVVFAYPRTISGDFQMTSVDIDIGDPGE